MIYLFIKTLFIILFININDHLDDLNRAKLYNVNLKLF